MNDRRELPDGVQTALSSMLTSEIATVGRDGTAAAWPMVPLWLPERGRIVLSTSIGFPAKAAHLRRDPRIALLFSDPTGSGLTDPPTVLVQGSATVSEEPATVGPDLLAHWGRVNTLQPISRHFSGSSPARWFMDWYYIRLLIEITPHRFLWWPGRDTTSPPEVLEIAPADSTPDGYGSRDHDADDQTAMETLVQRLDRFDSAVLTGRDDLGRPVAVRGRPRVDGGAVHLPDTPGTGLAAGPASLLFHGHDEKLWNLRSFQARGQLLPAADGWAFRAQRIVDGTGMAGPFGDLAAFVAARRRAGRHLARRGLERPSIPWSVLRAAR